MSDAVYINEGSIVELNPDDAALVIRKDLSLEVYFPTDDVDKAKTAPQSVNLIAGIGYLLAKPDTEFIDYIIDKYKEAILETRKKGSH